MTADWEKMCIAKMMKDSILRNQKDTLKKSTRVSITDIKRIKGYDFYGINIIMHRYPRWLGLTRHLVLERICHQLPRNGWRSVLKHILHGLICDYNMREIIKYLRWKPTDRGIAP